MATSPSSAPPAPSSSIASAPPPWTTRSTAYLLPFYHSPSQPLPSKAYTPLSASHAPFSQEPQCGVFKGGLGMLYLLRYTETPVGSYDELAIMPGYFETSKEKGDGKENNGKQAKNMRITAIWVSQRDTCYNGRRNWNIPKHIARFKFTPTDDVPGSAPVPPLKIEVFPEDPSATRPFFTANIQPIRWLPSFPCSFAWASYFGMDTSIIQPPLPQGEAPELCGTEDWKKSQPVLSSRKARLVWIDMKQPQSHPEMASEGQEEGDALLQKRPKEENWWPGLRRWHIGLWFENAALDLGWPEIWT